MAKPDTDRKLIELKGFSEFVKRAWPQIEATPLVFEPHMDLLCSHLEAVLDGFDPTKPRDEIIQEMVMNVPPGTSKSTVTSVLFPAYAWIRFIWLKFMCLTYDEKLSLSFAKRSMQLMQGDWFKERWPGVKILGGERAPVGLFENSEGGLRFSTMMGGAATGRHAHILLVDDPHKPDDLTGGGESTMAALDLAWERWTGTFCRRVADAATFVKLCIMQRLHESDLSGRMLAGENVVHLCLPMEFEPQRAHRSRWGNDPRTQEGELLCPVRFPAEYIYGVKNGPTGLTARGYAGQMQQRPAPEAGAMLMREWFTQRWDQIPPGRTIISIDASLKDHKDADFCVLQVWLHASPNFYLLDQVRRRMSFSETVTEAISLRARWSNVQYVIIEDKANGTAIIDTLKQRMTGVLPVNPEGGKYSRVNAIEPLLRSGNVFFPKRSWMDAFIEECVTFPVGAYDDQVDNMAQALNWLSGRTRNSKMKIAMENFRTGRISLTRRPGGR